jgi:uncharacterized phiE125 gp8 family phage protein
MALTTMTKLKAHLKISADTDNALLAVLVIAAQKLIEKYCGCKFDAADYTEYYDGTGEQDLYLNNRPVNSVASLYIDLERAYGSDSLLVAETDYTIYKNEGRVRILSLLTNVAYQNPGRIPVGEKAVKVTYNAGYASIPEDLELAANEMAAFLYNSRGTSSNKQSISVGGYSESFDKNPVSIPEHVRMLLDPYCRSTVAPVGSTT